MTLHAAFGSTFAIACLVVVTGCAPEGSDSAEPGALELTLDNIHRAGSGVADAVLSPDGARVAVAGAGPDGPGIYLVDAAGDAAPRLWSTGSAPSWAPDGASVAVVRDGEVWTVPVGGGEASAVTTTAGGARDPVFSPDGSTIAFYVAGEESQDLWVVDADGATEPRRLTEGAMSPDDGRFRPAWSPDGRSIAYVSYAADYWHDDVWVVDVDTGQTRQLSTGLMASSTPVWSPDGTRIALFGTSKSEYWYQDLAYIYLLDPETGDESVVDMTVYATDFIMRHRPIWSGDGNTIYFPYQQRGSTDLWAVPAEGGVATRVTNLGGAVRGVDADAEAESFVLVRSGPTSGSEVYLLPAAGGPAEPITDFAPRWQDVRAPREVSFASFDGLHIQGFLYTPPQLEDGARCPALVQVHGGGTNSYLNGLNLTEQYLASRGYVVLAINYRGGSGFGRVFQDLAIEDWLNEQALDAGAAADFLRRLPMTNGRVGIYGGSYGGSMSLAAATRTPDNFDAVVPMRGAYSKTETLEYTDRLGRIFTITGHGGTPEERPEVYAKSNTVERLENLTAPVLLMHGELDRRVPIQHFEIAVEELRRLGKSFETKTYPDEGHGFRNPDNRIDMYARLESFFERHLGGCGGAS